MVILIVPHPVRRDPDEIAHEAEVDGPALASRVDSAAAG
jgi:hypothetical protein